MRRVSLLCLTQPLDTLQTFIAMMGGVINALNTRLDPSTIAFIIDHGESDVFIVDTEYGGMVRDALPNIKRKVMIIDVVDDQVWHPSSFFLFLSHLHSSMTTGTRSVFLK